MKLPPHRRALGGISSAQVARDHDVPIHVVHYWLQIGNIFPTPAFAGGRYLIPPRYVVLNPALRAQWNPDHYTPTGRPVGRPKGVKNSRPYPTGVKRPRRKPDQSGEAASPKK